MVSITVPAQQQPQQLTQQTLTASLAGTGVLTTQVAAQSTYVFDAVLRLPHGQRLTTTKHPVQTGADLTSHAYLEPATLSMDVGMSDVMDAYATTASSNTAPYITPFSGGTTKSVSAYQTMLTIQAARIPLTVTTKLRTYTNMLLLNVEAEEDSRTITGLRMRLDFQQIFTALLTPAISARNQATGATGLGAITGQNPPSSISSQFGIVPSNADTLGGLMDNLLGYLNANPSGVDVPGAGTYSSVNTNNLQQLAGPK
jgi:hypothetical protein